MEILKVEEPAVLTWNEQDRAAMVTVDLYRHGAVENIAVVVEIINFHGKPLSSKAGCR